MRTHKKTGGAGSRCARGYSKWTPKARRELVQDTALARFRKEIDLTSRPVGDDYGDHSRNTEDWLMPKISKTIDDVVHVEKVCRPRRKGLQKY